MKRTIAGVFLCGALTLGLAACGSSTQQGGASPSASPDERSISLSDDAITLDGQKISSDTSGAVTVSHDIVYYQAGMGGDYGEGTQGDEHTQEEADAHTVVTIREAGTYRVSGTLSAGQLAIDLGEDAKTDPDAVVDLILDNADITCTVAPAVIFYNVYECDTAWVAYDNEETGDYPYSPIVDTSAAGANVILADGSVNNIDGSYVARIYREGTTKKLHKYDGAFYSKMSMNISGEAEGTGVLNITAANEGLDSELHLTINSGNINIQSENDGINTNEDGVSVTTINGGTVQINAGLGAEGDGIDSNGHLVINGGNVYTMANDRSPDGGIDADGDILINGGFVVALGVRNDTVSPDSKQQYMELSFVSALPAGSAVELKDSDGNTLLSFHTEKSCQSLTFSSEALTTDTAYTLTVDGVVQQYTGSQSGGFGGHMGGGQGQPAPDNMPEPPDGQEPPSRPEGEFKPDGLPDGQEPPQRPELPEGQEPPEGFQGSRPGEQPISGGGSTEFILTDTAHSFSGVSNSAQDGVEETS